MKNIKYFTRLTFFCTIVLFSACESMELELSDNPNLLSPSQASPDFFLNAIQVDFARSVVESFGRTGAQFTRIEQMAGRDYANAISPATSDTRWTFAYQRIMFDIHTMNELAQEKGLLYHVGMGQVIEAYTLLTLVDFYGDVPYTEAFLGADNLNPSQDDGASVYQLQLPY